MDSDLDHLSLLRDDNLVPVLLPGDRLLSLLVGLALSDLPFVDLDLVLEALLDLEARLGLKAFIVFEALLVFEARLVLDDLLILHCDLLRLRVEIVLDLLLL